MTFRTPNIPWRTTASPLRALRIVTVSDGHQTAEDVVLDHADATTRFGPDTAALIFDDQPGPVDLNYRAAVLRYGTPAAALIFPAAAADAPAEGDDDEALPALPQVDRVVS